MRLTFPHGRGCRCPGCSEHRIVQMRYLGQDYRGDHSGWCRCAPCQDIRVVGYLSLSLVVVLILGTLVWATRRADRGIERAEIILHRQKAAKAYDLSAFTTKSWRAR